MLNKPKKWCRKINLKKDIKMVLIEKEEKRPDMWALKPRLARLGLKGHMTSLLPLFLFSKKKIGKWYVTVCTQILVTTVVIGKSGLQVF